MDSLSRNAERPVPAANSVTSSPQSWPLSWIARSHRALVFGRRARVLADALAPLIPAGAGSVLDIGCGDGTNAGLLAERRPDLAVEGVGGVPRPTCRIPCRAFDGAKLPFSDRSMEYFSIVALIIPTADV